MAGASAAGRTGEIEIEKSFQNLVVGKIGRPAIGGGDRRIEIGMGVGEPRRAGVVEIGQRPLIEFGTRGETEWYRKNYVSLFSMSSPFPCSVNQYQRGCSQNPLDKQIRTFCIQHNLLVARQKPCAPQFFHYC